MPRYDLPSDLTPEQVRAVVAALEATLGGRRADASPWALAGRAEALRLGSLQARRDVPDAWSQRGGLPYARRATPPLVGRGDAK